MSGLILTWPFDMACIIRRARPADLDGLLALLHLLFGIEEDFDFDPDRQRRGLALMLAHDGAVVLVAEVDHLVVGMCSGQLTISTAEGGVALLVEDVVVAREYQGLGLGRQLLQALEQWAEDQQIGRLQLLADRHNKNATIFYEKMGWQGTGLICLRKRVPVKRQEVVSC